jgi:hypothetical protein
VRQAYISIVKNFEGKKSFSWFRCRWEAKVEVDVKETGPEDMDCTHMASDGVEWRAS